MQPQRQQQLSSFNLFSDINTRRLSRKRGSAQRLPHKPTFQPGLLVHQAQSDIARNHRQRVPATKAALEPFHRRHHGEVFGLSLALIALQYNRAVDRQTFGFARGQLFSQHPDITEAQIDALACERVNAVGRIGHQHQTCHRYSQPRGTA